MRYLIDFFTIGPMAVLQLVMAIALFRWLGKKWQREQRRAVWTGGLVVVEITVFAIMFMGFCATDPALWWVVGNQTWLLSISEGFLYLWGYSSGAAFLIFLLYRFLHRRIAPKLRPDRRAFLETSSKLAIAAPFAALAYGTLIGRVDFHVREVDVPIPGLPPDLENLRILQLSDIHLSAYLSERQLARVIDAANELKPHLAVLTGDYISKSGDPLDACLRQVARLRAEAGVIGVMGNHEVYAQCQDYTKEQGGRLGIPFLRMQNQTLQFGSAHLNIAGVDHQPFIDKAHYLVGAEELILPGTTNLLLSHNPDVFPVAARQGYDLMLSGHTHGGQVTVEILNQTVNVARFFTRYVSGLYQLDSSTCYVTRGIGTIGLPARLGATPEITLLRLRNAANRPESRTPSVRLRHGSEIKREAERS